MNVIDLTEFFSERGGGVRTHLESKGQALRARGHRQLVIAPGPMQEDHQTGLVRVGGPSLPYDPTYHLLLRLDRVAARVRAEHPEILEIHSPYLALAAGLAVPRRHFGLLTFFWHADFVDTYLRPALDRRVGRGAGSAVASAAWAGVRSLLSRCDAVLVAGQAQLDKLRHHGVPRLAALPFGVDKRIFNPDANLATPGGEVGPGVTKVIAFGRFASEKRFDVVVDAFRRLASRRPAVLFLVGDGPERAALQARAQGLDVRFEGFIRDRNVLAARLASADLLLHGCPFETFGLAVAEARACGIPVVVPDQGGAGEGRDPACSESYLSGDPAACAAAAERLLSRDRAELRARAREASARVTSVDDHFDRLLQLYRDLLEAREARAAAPAPQ